MASAVAWMTASSMPQPKKFHEDHPKGGVRATPFCKAAQRCDASAAANASASERATRIVPRGAHFSRPPRLDAVNQHHAVCLGRIRSNSMHAKANEGAGIMRVAVHQQACRSVACRTVGAHALLH